MLGLTRETDYALVSLAHLSARVSPQSQPVSAREIAQEYGLPMALTMKVLKRLHQAGIISSTRGVHGGYHLAIDPAELRVMDVIGAIEGPLKVTACCDESSHGAPLPCEVTLRCPITSSVRRLNYEILGLLGEYTLADLMKGQSVGQIRLPQPADAANE